MQLFKKLGILPESQPRAVGAGFGQSDVVNVVEKDGSDDNDNEFADVAATYILHPGDNRPYGRVKIGDEFLDGLLDSGANVTILGVGCFERVKRWGLPIVETAGTVRTADGTVRKITSCVDVPYEFEGQMHVVRTYLLEHITQALILGTDFWRAFQIEPRSCAMLEAMETDATDVDSPKVSPVSEPHELNEEQTLRLNESVSRFPFSKPDGELNCTTLVQHHIDTGDAAPIKQRQYLMSPYVQAKVEIEIKRLLERGIIERIENPAWLNPVIPVNKSNGGIRLCIDARKLNSVTVKSAYPQQNINRILGRLKGTKFLSALDMNDAFYQIALDEESRPKTAFSIPSLGTFMYSRMPMGLCNSGATLCGLVDRLFGSAFEPETFPYLDDFIIATNEFDQHIDTLDRVSAKLNEGELKISATKSKFCMKAIKYLGHILDKDGIKPDPEKIEPILSYPAPKSVKEVRRLMGMVGWYRRFIKDFSTLTAPITELLKQNQMRFSWSDAANDAFERLKRALVSTPILATPDYTLPFVVQTDASDVGIGAVLTQVIDGEERVIAYMSRKLTGAERKYHVTERECLAVLAAVEKFRPYIEGVSFTVITDHASLQWLQNLKDPTGRLGRWALRLQGHTFDLIHRKGALNVVPDALSRACEALELSEIDTTLKTNDAWYNALVARKDRNGLIGKMYRYEKHHLYAFVARAENPAHEGWKKCVPKEFVEETIRENHDDVFAAHGGFHKTVSRIRERYFWPSLRDDVRAYVNNCTVCRAIKSSNLALGPPMGEFRDPVQPFRIVSIDYCGPYTRSKSGNKWLLVMVDMFSKYVVIEPLRKSSAAQTIDRMRRELFLKFGVPEIVISDNGPQLKSLVFSDFLGEFGVKHWLTANYHAQANPTEAANKTILNAIRSYIADEAAHTRWDEHTVDIAFALNSSLHSTTKRTPHQIIFGKTLPVNGDEYGELHRETQDDEALRDERRKEIHRRVAENLRKSYETSRKRYDESNTSDIEYKVGDTVWRRNTKLSEGSKNYCAKLDKRFVQCTVVRRVGTNTYEVRDVDRDRIAIYHASYLKPN